MIRNKKTFGIGLMLAASFFVVLFWIFTPTFGGGMNGLQYSDDMFNKLSKGSSYFIPKVAEKNEKFNGKPFEVTITLEAKEVIESAEMLFEHAGADVTVSGNDVSIKGDLGKVLASALEDADAMYKNDGMKVATKYGYNGGKAILAKYGGEKAEDPKAIGEKVLVSGWWHALSKMDKKLQRDGKVAEAKMVSDVTKKAIEPGYNYYGVEAKKVAEKAGIMSGLLIFYVVYTLWFGYAVFYIFDGIGLAMTKGKKAEA